MKFLKEQFLLEKIDDVRKYYPTIPDEMFNDLIRLDPTFNKDRDSLGTYGKWILNLYKKNKLEEKDFLDLAQALNEFEKVRAHLNNKDINSYKDLNMLEQAIEQAEVILSDRQKLRQTQKAVRATDIEEGATKIYEDSDWVVYTPNTYEASCKLGRGTNWCTATTENDENYKDYTKDGPLFIVINKHNPKKKYQFHFEREEFKDANNSTISIQDFLVSKPDLHGGAFVGIDKALDDTLEWLYNNEDGVYHYGEDEEQDYYVFHAICGNVKHLVISGNIDEVDNTFSYMCYLETVEIQEGVRSISYSAFKGCSSLVNVKLPNSIEVIEDDAFKFCENLVNITLPDSIKVIGQDVFFGCLSLTSINIPKNLEIIERHLFENCESLKSINIPESVIEIGRDAFAGCKSLTQIKLPSSVTVINSGTFWDCINLEKVEISESTERIGVIAFGRCEKLKEIRLPDSLQVIGENAFNETISLRELFIPYNVEMDGMGIFDGCDSLILYCEAPKQPKDWAEDWDSGFEGRIIWGAERPINESVATLRFDKTNKQ